MMPAKFVCPPGMVRHMAELFGTVCRECGEVSPVDGEYACMHGFADPPVCVDVGACVGGFARWAEMYWPGAKVHCFEPNPRVHGMLERNLSVMGSRASLTKAAVLVTDEPTVRLYTGRNNVGEASIIREYAGAEEEDFVDVPAVCVTTLPECNVLKLDCEGNEPELFHRYVATHKPPHLMLAEYHSPADMMLFQSMAIGLGYRIVRVREHSFGRGVVCMRKNP